MYDLEKCIHLKIKCNRMNIKKNVINTSALMAQKRIYNFFFLCTTNQAFAPLHKLRLTPGVASLMSQDDLDRRSAH